MDGISIVYIILFFLCLLFSAFFSSSETAFISLQKIRLRHLVNTGVAGADEVARITERPEKLLTAILIGNNFTNTAAAALGTSIAIVLLPPEWGVLVATIAVTFLLLIFSEITPKTLATRMGERMAFFYIRPIKVISWILFPITVIFSAIGAGLARLIGGTPPSQELITEEEIRTMVSVGREAGTVEETEAEMVERVFRFGDRQVHELMTPRPDIVWIEKGTKLDEFLPIYAKSSYSRFPIYEETTDNVTGILWIKDILLALANDSLAKQSAVTELSRPAYFVPESKSAGELFAEMQATGNQMTIIIDEYGDTAGLVTLEQLVEEIVGELEDELTRGRKEFEIIDANTFQIDGGMKLAEANEELELELPEGSYETVAGFILSLLGRIPKEGEQLKYRGMKLTITEIKGLKIEKVLVTKEGNAAAAPDI
jgi:putative hemolysin